MKDLKKALFDYIRHEYTVQFQIMDFSWIVFINRSENQGGLEAKNSF